MREFTLPRVTTRDERGEVKLEYAFQLRAQFEPLRETRSARGTRLYQDISGGEFTGRVSGKVYPDSGGEYGLLRADGVEDISQRFMINTSDGEWLYIAHSGYRRRRDGYYRVQVNFDADLRGNYAWLNDAVWIATVEAGADRRSATYSYYEVT
jgi:hypothetical protein